MLDNINEQDKPNYSGYFIGTVVYNDDPEHIERIKVTIPSLFVGAPDTLPWLGKKKAELFPDSTNGTYGTFGLVPKVGDQVIVEFQDSNPLYGLYSGMPHQSNERVAEALVNYLYRYGFKDPAGNLFMVDTKPGAVEILIQHVSGTLLRINNSGSIDLLAIGDITSSSPQWNHTGPVNITGNVAVTGGITSTLDTVAGGKSLMLHTHSAVKFGTDISGPPV